jgi:DNA repair protein RadC
MMIREAFKSERPRERLLQTGATGLSLRELIAVLLGSGPRRRGCLGLAGDLLEATGHPPASGEAERAFFLELEAGSGARSLAVHGLGLVGRCRLLAAFELGRRYALHREAHSRCGRGGFRPAAAAGAVARIGSEWRAAVFEWFGFIPFYGAAKHGALVVVARGARDQVTIDLKDLFARILSLRPRGILLVHNHPSGQLEPSLEDCDLTRQIGAMTEPFAIEVLGHWIVCGARQRAMRLAWSDAVGTGAVERRR